MTRPPSALPARVAVKPEAFGGDGPSWVVARAEAELVERYDHLDESERGLTAAMFEPPVGIFLVARSKEHPRPVGGVGVRRVGPPGTGEVKCLWVDPAWRGGGLGRRLIAAGSKVRPPADCGNAAAGKSTRRPVAKPGSATE